MASACESAVSTVCSILSQTDMRDSISETTSSATSSDTIGTSVFLISSNPNPNFPPPLLLRSNSFCP